MPEEQYGPRDRRPRRFTALFCTFAITLTSSPALAQQHNNDFQVWTYATVTAPVIKNVEATGDLHVGVTDDASHVSEFLGRAILYYKLDDRFKLGGGYTFLGVRDGSVRFSEHRIIQDVSFTTKPPNGDVTLTLRPRLEERFQEGKQGTAVRLRLLARIDVPVFGKSGIKGKLWTEPFYSLNQTTWSGKTGVGAMFNFIGLGIPLTSKITLEPGYLNFTTFAPGHDQVRHILAAFVSVRL